ncbi:MAG: hypothetical protein ACI8XB_002647 [Patiriisocius sp.]|jgi:hypothetical protein
MAYEVVVLSEFKINPLTLGVILILILTGIIIRSAKPIWIYIFIAIHTLLMVFGYIRPLFFE